MKIKKNTNTIGQNCETTSSAFYLYVSACIHMYKVSSKTKTKQKIESLNLT